MICRVEFDYEARPKLVEAAADPAKLHILRGIFGDQTPKDERLSQSYAWPLESLIDMSTDGPNLINLGIPFTVKSFKGTMSIGTAMGSVLPKDAREVKVVIQVPHVGLLAIEEVDVIENACTDLLQLRLDEGWRILAVCPPNAARRPDYIIGRTKGEKDGR